MVDGTSETCPGGQPAVSLVAAKPRRDPAGPTLRQLRVKREPGTQKRLTRGSGDTRLGGLPRHRPLWEWAGGGESPAETQRRGGISKNSASLRLCGRITLMHRETPLGGRPWHRPLSEWAWGGNRARRRRDAEVSARTLRLCVSAGGSPSCTRSSQIPASPGGTLSIYNPANHGWLPANTPS